MLTLVPDLPIPDTSAFTAETVAHLRNIAERVNDIRTLLHDGEYHWLKGWSNDSLLAVGQACAATPFDGRVSSPARTAPYLALARLLQVVGLEPASTTDDTADFTWSGLRCIFAGAGHPAHRAIAEELLALNPHCPFGPEESFTTWTEQLHIAHQNSGLPATLTLAPASVMLRGLDDAPGADVDARWLKAIVALFILRHVRSHEATLRVTLHGRISVLSVANPKHSGLGDPILATPLVRDLHFPASSGRDALFAGIVAKGVLNALSLHDLIPCTSLRYMPACYIAGPAVHLVSGSRHDTTATEANVRVSGLWRATDAGKVLPCAGDEDLALAWAWPVARARDAANDDHLKFASTLPTTYEAVSPADEILRVWPNLDLDWCEDADAYLSIIDALLCGSSIRNEAPHLWMDELPLVFVMPAVPTHAESTNTGKTVLAQALVRSFVPHLPSATPGKGTSAPDARAIANYISTWGTIMCDEWKPPKDPAHPLHRDQLQSLATGSGLVVGKVMDNVGHTVRPSFPLVFNTKGFNIPDDINTRMIPLLLKQLPAEVRAHTLDPQIGTRLRLAAYAMARELRLGEAPGELGIQGMRFKRHAFIAARIYEARTGRTHAEAVAAIDATGVAMQAKLRWHVATATDSDLLAEQERGESLILRWADVAPSITPVMAQGMASMQTTKTHSAGQLLRFFGAVNGLDTGSARMILERLVGLRIDGADRVIGTALARDLLHRMPNVGDCTPLGDDACTLAGYLLERKVDSSSGGRQFYIRRQNV